MRKGRESRRRSGRRGGGGGARHRSSKDWGFPSSSSSHIGSSPSSSPLRLHSTSDICDIAQQDRVLGTLSYASQRLAHFFLCSRNKTPWPEICHLHL
uniref:Uncharacterized protein n=1 Tax=Arundo donax TaxID=35708 RepID=A0A0A9EPE9_ARUDO